MIGSPELPLHNLLGGYIQACIPLTGARQLCAGAGVVDARHGRGAQARLRLQAFVIQETDVRGERVA